MTPAERGAKLRAAAALVADVSRDLDSSASECECCQAIRYNHYGERKMFDMLDALVGKLTHHAKETERGLNKERQERKRD